MHYFRYYPKADGSFYTYDPSEALSENDVEELSNELKDEVVKLNSILKYIEKRFLDWGC